MSSMGSKEIISIIKACKASGVKSVKFEGLELEFHQDLTNDEKSDHNGTKAVLFNEVQETPEVQTIDDLEDDAGFVGIHDEFAMQNLMINEPDKFEAYQRDLNNGRN